MSKFRNINIPLNLTGKEETLLELYRQWNIRCYTQDDAVREAMREYVRIKEQWSRDEYWERVHNSELEKGDTADLDRDPIPIYDREELSLEEAAFLEYYINYTKWLEGHPLTHKWDSLRAARAEAWSDFLEEVDTNWLRVIRYEEKLNHRLYLMEREGKTPTPESWAKAMAHLSKLRADVVRFYTDSQGNERVDYRGFQGDTWTSRRNRVTFPLFQRAQAATKAAADFWKTPEGEKLTSLKERRAQIWKRICELGLQTRFTELNQLINNEINLNLIWGEVTEDVDSFGTSQQDRTQDVDPKLWWQIAGLPTEDHYHVCIYETGGKAPTSQDALDEYYTSAREEEDMIAQEIDNLIVEGSWSLEEEEAYLESLQYMQQPAIHEKGWDVDLELKK